MAFFKYSLIRGVLFLAFFLIAYMALDFSPLTAALINQTRAPAHLSNISLYGNLAAAPAPLMDIYVDCKAPVAGIGTEARPLNSMEQFRQLEIAAGATIHFKAGNDCAASTTPFWGYGTADKPITVTTYGDGAPALIGGKPLADTFAKRAAQGWVVADAAVEPATPAIALDTAAVTAGETTKVTLTGFAPNTEVAVELRPGAVNLGKVTTNGEGTASITVTIPEGTASGDFTVAAVQGDSSATAPLKVTAVEVTTPPTTQPTDEPTVAPTDEPTVEPTDEPTVEPTDEPTVEPTDEPTVEPTDEPSVSPTATDSAPATDATTAASSSKPATDTPASSKPAADKGDGLASTGATSTTGLLLAFVLLLGGAASVLMVRRRGKRT